MTTTTATLHHSKMATVTSRTSSSDMTTLPEVAAAVRFIADQLSAIGEPLSKARFTAILTESLQARCRGHWHVDNPEKGSAYRCITRSGPGLADIDQLVISALVSAKFDTSLRKLSDAMRKNMHAAHDKWTLWIDPGCVSIRLHDLHSSARENGSSNGLGGVFFDMPDASANKAASSLSGIKVIYGQLPTSLTVASATPVMQHRSVIPASNMTPSRSPQPTTISAAAQAEFADLIINASPSKRSKAIAIVRPPTAAGSSVVSTPPRAPLSFTFDESTSPYVPTFTAYRVNDNAVAAGSPTSRTITPLAPSLSPLSTISTLVQADNDESTRAVSPSLDSATLGSDHDQYLRPSSRSSTGSADSAESSSSLASAMSGISISSAAVSAESCSVFSHVSTESQGSMDSSLETPSSESCGPTSLMATVAKASSTEAEKAKAWTFPNPANVDADGFAVPMLPSRSRNATAPAGLASPSKRRNPGAQGPRHAHTPSNASAMSAGSSSSERPAHARARSSQSSQTNVRVSTSNGTVQDYSNGKVGVLGGGVLLGMGGNGGSSSEGADKRRRGGSHSKNVSTASSASAASSQHLGAMPDRPRSRSKSRNASAHGSHTPQQFWNPGMQNPYAVQQQQYQYPQMQGYPPMGQWYPQ